MKMIGCLKEVSQHVINTRVSSFKQTICLLITKHGFANLHQQKIDNLIIKELSGF